MFDNLMALLAGVAIGAGGSLAYMAALTVRALRPKPAPVEEAAQ